MEYAYDSFEPKFTAAYLWPFVLEALQRLAPPPRDVFEIGCGNGATAAMLTRLGYRVTGIDPSESGIAIAQKSLPEASLHAGSVYDDLAGRFGRFPIVISLEVIEHCADSQGFMHTFQSLLQDGGIGLLSTPYHGYLKNIAIATSGKFDHHFNPLWQGGHVKFFSIATLKKLIRESGLQPLSFHRLGRIPPLAKSLGAVVMR